MMKINDLKGILAAKWVFLKKGNKTVEEVRFIEKTDYFYHTYGNCEIEKLTSFPARDEKIIIKIKEPN